MLALGRTHLPLPLRGGFSQPHPPRRVRLDCTCRPPSRRIVLGRAHPHRHRFARIGFDSSSLVLPCCHWVFFPLPPPHFVLGWVCVPPPLPRRIGLGLCPSSASSCWVGSAPSSSALSCWAALPFPPFASSVVGGCYVSLIGGVIDSWCFRWAVFSMGGVLSKQGVCSRWVVFSMGGAHTYGGVGWCVSSITVACRCWAVWGRPLFIEVVVVLRSSSPMWLSSSLLLAASYAASYWV